MDIGTILILTSYFLSVAISICLLTFFSIRAKKTALFRSFFVLQIIQIIWLVSKFFRIIAPSYSIGWIMTVIQYGAICFVGAGYLNFAYHYKTGKKLNLVFRYILFSISFLNLLAVITNPFHYLFFSNFSIIEAGRGPLFYVHTAFSYTVLIVGLSYLFRGVYEKVLKDMGSIQILYYLGLLLPLMINIFELFNIIPFVHDLTPIGFNTSYLVYGVVAYRHQFMDIRKVARYEIYEHMQEGIIIFDKNYQVETVNTVISEYLPNEIDIYEGMELRTFIQAFRNIIVNAESIYQAFTDFIYSIEKRTEMEVKLVHDDQHNYYLLDIQKSGINQGKLIVRVLEVNRYRFAIEQLEEHNRALQAVHNFLAEELAVKKKLVVAKERNRVSKEVHDTLGHSLTVVISLIEASKMVLFKSHDQAKEKIDMALSTARYNFKNLKKNLSNPNHSAMTGEKLIDDIRTMVKSVEKTGTVVELVTRNYDIAVPTQYYDAIYHMCQEGLTNAIRHGKAQSVTIALRFSEALIDLTIIDNGTGAETFIMGNGLKYMEKKVKDFNGYFSCGSLGKEGFSIHIKLPLL